MANVDSRPTPLAQLRGLTAAEVAKLKTASITNNEQLLAAAKTRTAEVKLAKQTGIGLGRMREAVNRADLVRLDGIGPAAADLFENAGVNSVKELAQRNPTSLHAALVKYAATRPELGYQVPSQAQVTVLVTKAAAAGEPTPAKTLEQQAAEGMTDYVGRVLFSNDPEGATFRDAVVAWRTPAEQTKLQNDMRADVARFMSDPDTEKYETSTTITWAGRWIDLYSEVTVKKTGGVERVYVEID